MKPKKMESSGRKMGQTNKGFVTFKMSKSSNNEDQYIEKEKGPKCDSVKIPHHVRQRMSQLNKGVSTKTKTTASSKGSKEYRSEAEKLRAELAELKRQKEMLNSK